MDPPLAVIFTTFSNRSEKIPIYTNAVRNWASFLPHIQPVLFTTFPEGPIIDIVRRHGWYIYPNLKENEFGSPVLKEMFLSSFNRSKATLHGFVNGDILFDEGLNKTLSKMKELNATLKTSLLFGRRRNYNMTSSSVNGTLPVLWRAMDVKGLANSKNSTLFRMDAFDYFFVTRDYPFAKFKPLVISRSGFDTYFAAVTNTWGFTTIDGTGAISAIHQTDRDGNFAHTKPKNQSDTLYNRKLIGGKFHYGPGYATNAKYQATLDKNSTAVFLKCLKCKGKKNLV